MITRLRLLELPRSPPRSLLPLTVLLCSHLNANMRRNNGRKKHSTAHCAKISKTMKGKKHSAESCAKMSKAKKGKKS